MHEVGKLPLLSFFPLHFLGARDPLWLKPEGPHT